MIKKMKKFYIMMLLSVAFLSINAQSFSWARKGGLWQYDYGFGIAQDPSGNVYVAGKYEREANFSGTILPNDGNHDIYLAKYNSAGDLLWIRTAGGYSGDYALAVVCDNNYVYISGEIQGSNANIVFHGSPITLTCKGSNDIFIAKYTFGGSLIWARRAGGSLYEKAYAMTLDKMGNIYIAGIFFDNCTFGGTTTIHGYGNKDFYIAKYDVDGNFKWVRNGGSAGRDEAHGIACDSYGNVYMCGYYRDGCHLGGQTLSSPNGKSNMFLVKYSPSGSMIWVKTGGGTWDDVGWSMVIDSNNKLFVAGEFNGYASFNGTHISTSGAADIFVANYDTNGNLMWIKKAGGDLPDRAKGIYCAGNRLFITGAYGATAQFGPYYKTAADSSDIFIASLDKTGVFKWVLTGGGQADAYEDLGYESGIAVVADMSGNVYGTGSMLNGATFGSTTLKPWTRTDMFLAKIIAPPPGREPDEMIAGDDLLRQEEGTDRTMENASELPEQAKLNVYPNPSDGKFSLDLNGSSGTYELWIFNNLGQLVKTDRLTAPTLINIDLSGYKQGIYYMQLKAADADIRRRIIIQ
jgi:hypothetical protein